MGQGVGPYIPIFFLRFNFLFFFWIISPFYALFSGRIRLLFFGYFFFVRKKKTQTKNDTQEKDHLSFGPPPL